MKTLNTIPFITTVSNKKLFSHKSTLLIVLSFIMISFTNYAQCVWHGGYPGSESHWNNPKNWSENRVPGNHDTVEIPNLDTKGEFYPIISDQVEAIACLILRNGAELTINEQGILVIDGSSTFDNGLFNQGDLIVEGALKIINTAKEPICKNTSGRLHYLFNTLSESIVDR